MVWISVPPHDMNCKTASNCVMYSSDNYVRIYNRHGEAVAEFGLPGSCTGFGWDQDGDTLAVICDKSGIIYLWDANNRKLSQVDSGFKDTLTFMTWSKDAPLLAIGTVKGNLLIFSHRNARKIPLLGKHTKRIKAGAWSNKNLLALSGEDKLLTISNAEGDTLHQILVGGDPENIQFSEMKSNERSNMGENTVSLIKNKKTLFLYNMNDPENPVELAFQQKYGDISAYHWYGDGYIMIGFSQGYFVVISTHLKEIGQEIYQVRNHKDNLCSIAISQSLGKAASAGDNCVKIHDLQDLKQLHDIVTLEDERSLDRIGWTEDGQLLAIATSRGAVHVFLTKLPVLGASNFTRIAYLTSLLEVTIQDNIHDEKPIAVPIEVESSFMALGPYHLVVGMNNRAWVHVLTEKGIVRMKERDYLSTVDSCKVNSDYIAVLCSDGKLTLQMIDELQPGMSPEKETRMFPDNNKDRITCHDMSRDFLIYGTDKGKIYYFYMEDWNFVTECDHSANTASRSVVGIRKLFADTSGSHLIYIDDKSDGFLYNPVIDASLEIPNISPKTVGALWDCNPPDKGVFITYDTERIFTYIYLRESSKGPRVSFVGETKLPYGHEPLMLHSGSLTLMTTSGSVQIVTLETHAFLMSDRQQTYEQKQINLGKAVALRRFRDAYQLCVELKQPNAWMDLASAALESLDIEFAIKVYRLLGDVGMVMSLQTIKDVEDRNLLAGYVAMFLEDFTSAQDLFLSSSRPVAALEMRRDLMNWDAALQLAKTLASHEIPFISREYAQQLEFTGDYVSALRHYEAGVTKDERFGEHDEACAAGVARTCLRTGDLRRGVKMALMMPSISLKKECAAILEGMKQFTESAMLYEKGGFPDKAASVYIRAKNWTKVGELLPLVSSPKIHGQYARAKEAEGRYKEAAAAYENAKDWDNVIRVNLEHLRNPDEAVRIVRSTQSVDGAKMVAKFFENLKDYHSAIQFLVLSKCNDEAFQMAQKHRLMEKYAEIVGSDATAEDYQSIAVYFEGEKNHFLAGKFYHLSGQHAQALNHLLNIREDEAEHTDALNLAVDVIGSAADQKLTMHLMSFLLGDVDGNPKDPKFLFRLYMALKQYREAARTATVIAREEQNAGSYRTAHDLLFSMYHELRKNKIKIPAEMGNSLMILHSYILVKMHVKREDHLKAARMLIRVANNISKFPSHIVNILTSTVIECQRAGLKNSAFGFAAMLMRPEYRDKIDLKYKKKLEMIVRKPDKSELEEPTSPCPYCGEILAETELVCSGCKNNIPFCIATGRHIVKDDLTVCPNCQFPAIMPDLISLLASEDGRCPMCSEKVDIQSIEKVTNLSSVLNPDEGAED